MKGAEANHVFAPPLQLEKLAHQGNQIGALPDFINYLFRDALRHYQHLSFSLMMMRNRSPGSFEVAGAGLLLSNRQLYKMLTI